MFITLNSYLKQFIKNMLDLGIVKQWIQKKGISRSVEIVMNEEMKSALKEFNDEFMFMWYKGWEHILARDMEAEMFSYLIPRNLAYKRNVVNSDLNDSK